MNLDRLRTYRLIVIWVIGLLFTFGWLSEYAHAELPPRPTKTPISKEDEATPEPPAGTIILNTQPAKDGLWSVVQWQGEENRWYDVEGWRGSVVNGKTIWWVEQGHWGRKPYRWVVLQEEEGELLGVSDLFTLPNSGETLIVKVNISD